jgi:hypothetical protein
MADLQKELDNLEKKIAEQLEAANKVKQINLILGIVLIIIIFGYFQFIYVKITPFAEPKPLAETVMGFASERVEHISEFADQQAKETVPKLLDDVIDGLIQDRIPNGRKELEKALKKELDIALGKTENGVMEAFDKAMEEHGNELHMLVKELQTNQGREAFEDDLFKIMDEAISEPDIKVQIDTYGIVLGDIDGLLKYYADPTTEKTDDQKLVAQMLSMVREISDRMQKSGKSLNLRDVIPGVEAPAAKSD